MIHRVNDSSPLFGQIFPGDVIVAVNNIDTRAMSAQAITSLMARTSSRRRKITVLSADVSEEPAPTAGVEESKDEEAEPVVTEETPEAVVADGPVAEETPVATEVTAEGGEEQASAQEDDIASVASSLRSEMQPRLVKAPPVG